MTGSVMPDLLRDCGPHAVVGGELGVGFINHGNSLPMPSG